MSSLSPDTVAQIITALLCLPSVAVIILFFFNKKKEKEKTEHKPTDHEIHGFTVTSSGAVLLYPNFFDIERIPPLTDLSKRKDYFYKDGIASFNSVDFGDLVTEVAFEEHTLEHLNNRRQITALAIALRKALPVSLLMVDPTTRLYYDSYLYYSAKTYGKMEFFEGDISAQKMAHVKRIYEQGGKVQFEDVEEQVRLYLPIIVNAILRERGNIPEFKSFAISVNRIFKHRYGPVLQTLPTDQLIVLTVAVALYVQLCIPRAYFMAAREWDASATVPTMSVYFYHYLLTRKDSEEAKQKPKLELVK